MKSVEGLPTRGACYPFHSMRYTFFCDSLPVERVKTLSLQLPQSSRYSPGVQRNPEELEFCLKVFPRLNSLLLADLKIDVQVTFLKLLYEVQYRA